MPDSTQPLTVNDATQPWLELMNTVDRQLQEILPAALTASGLCTVGNAVIEKNVVNGRLVAKSCSLPLVKRRKRKETIVAWLNYQISLDGPGLPRQSNGDVLQPVATPVLHVAHWTCEFSFEYESYVGFPASSWQPWNNQQQRLLSWDESESPFGDEWTYSLWLPELTTESLLQQCIVAPALALLSGSSVGDALPDSVPGLVCYEDVALPDGERDVRVIR